MDLLKNRGDDQGDVTIRSPIPIITNTFFAVFKYICCDDKYYGYNENFISAFETIEKAKEFVEKKILETTRKCNGENGNPFIIVVKMKMGDVKREIVFDSADI